MRGCRSSYTSRHNDQATALPIGGDHLVRKACNRMLWGESHPICTSFYGGLHTRRADSIYYSNKQNTRDTRFHSVEAFHRRHRLRQVADMSELTSSVNPPLAREPTEQAPTACRRVQPEEPASAQSATGQ